jgi:hypothetical protein
VGKSKNRAMFIDIDVEEIDKQKYWTRKNQ